MAESHAGYFERGKITRDKQDKVSCFIGINNCLLQDKIFAFFGDASSAMNFTHFEFNEIGVAQFQRLRGRLFSKITISGIFQVEVSDFQ